MSLSDLYKIEKIEGKGVGWIAQKDIKRGTLLLNEKPQIRDNGGYSWGGNPEWIKSLMKSFNQLSEANQKEFLTLHNNNLVQDLSHCPERSMELMILRKKVKKIYKKAHEVEKCLSIIGM